MPHFETSVPDRMNPFSPTVSAQFVRGILGNLRRSGRLDAGYIMQAGISPSLIEHESAQIPLEQFAALYRELAVAVDDETLALFSRPLRNGTLKFLCLTMLDADTLGTALHRFSGFMRLVLDDLCFVVSRQDGIARIVLAEQRVLGAGRVAALELMLMLVQGVASWMIGRRIPFVRIDLSYPAPTYAREYLHLYPGPSRFEQPVTALELDAAYLEQPIRRDKAALNEFLRQAPQGWFYVWPDDRPNTYRVREHLIAGQNIGHGFSDVAHALHVSGRSLARQLKSEGTHFQAVKDMLRCDLAIAQLSKTSEPVASIGMHLGFDDPTAFNRAFKKWTGSAPGAYRKP